MNITLWVLQIVLALHTGLGAVWKFSHSAEETMPSLKAISGGAWRGLGVVEVLASLALILPAFHKPLAMLVPIAATLLAAEMLAFCALHLRSGDPKLGPPIYWLVVAALCAFVAYGRLALQPL